MMHQELQVNQVLTVLPWSNPRRKDEMEIKNEWGTHPFSREDEKGGGKEGGGGGRTTSPPRTNLQRAQRAGEAPQSHGAAAGAVGSEAAVREGGRVADYNDCHNSTEYDHGAGMYACMQSLLHPPSTRVWCRGGERGCLKGVIPHFPRAHPPSSSLWTVCNAVPLSHRPWVQFEHLSASLKLDF